MIHIKSLTLLSKQTDTVYVNVPAISKHLKNIFAEGELSEQVVVSKMEITTEHGAIEGKTQSKE